MPQKESPFSEVDLGTLAKCLDGAATHKELGSLIRDVGLHECGDGSGYSKWQRIYNALAHAQNQTRTGNLAMKFIQTALSPKRFLNRAGEFDSLRTVVNEILAFRGWHLHGNGKFGPVVKATTIDEAKERAARLRSELERRRVHADVLAFCRAELLQENYFHAVLEATKSVSEKLRAKTSLTGDAGELAMKTLSLGQAGMPFLAFNPLVTETDKSEQSGLMNLFIGMFGAFRNVTAHGPKVNWVITEHDALDLMTLASMLHRRLDAAVRTARQA
ncbi:MAG: hypothetical protein QOD99_2557 [Chthoniobacter sp.]|jgi:uncharacterized protein (TIGR02391 family)|nr:hypothetical protein [Chthoniobacter sp.]